MALRYDNFVYYKPVNVLGNYFRMFRIFNAVPCALICFLIYESEAYCIILFRVKLENNIFVNIIEIKMDDDIYML